MPSQGQAKLFAQNRTYQLRLLGTLLCREQLNQLALSQTFLIAGLRDRQRNRWLRSLQLVRVGILGPLDVRIGGTPVQIRRGISRTMLIALALHVGETLNADALMELLWGESQPQNPVNALQVQMSHLRKVLEHATGDARSLIITRAGGYALDIETEDIDAIRFERLVREANTSTAFGPHGHPLALDLLDEALALWRGDALIDVAGQAFAAGETTRLTELRWAAIEARNDLRLSTGGHRELVGELRAAVDAQPLRERFHEQLMIALYRSGRQGDALRAYESARRALVEELGIGPGPRLQHVEKLILEQDESLDWTQKPSDVESGAPTEIVRPGSSVGRTRSELPLSVTSLIGRSVEMDRIAELLRRARVVTLTGPGGAGKSRLAIEAAHREAATREVWYVELSAVSAPDLVSATVAMCLGVSVQPDDDPIDRVVTALSLQRGLLLLDTCEHAVGAVADLVSGIARYCRDVTVLATSRRPLGVAGEVAWPVPPLALAPTQVVSADAASS